MRLVFLGPPGSGKGTQAKILAEKRNFSHISTGDVLRSAVKDGTELGKKAMAFMDAGDLVPDEIILGMIKEMLQKNSKGFILDGFPRTAGQAEGLENDEEVLKRLTGRFFCEECGSDFNVNTRPPKIAGLCDKCGGKLLQRNDDKTDVISNRLKVYREKTKPVEDFYRSRNILEDVDGTQSFDDVAAAIVKVVS